MKNFKGTFAFLLVCLLLLVPSLARAEELSALEAAERGTVVESDRASLEAFVDQTIQSITAMSDEEIQEWLSPSSILVSQNKKVMESVRSWADVKEDLGTFVEVEDHQIAVTDDEITIETLCTFEKGTATVTTVLDRKDSQFSASLSFAEGGNESLATAMGHAALNTVIGLGVVFVVLLFLTFLIGQFRHVAALEGKFAKKPAEKEQPPAPAVPVEEVLQTEELAGDDDLVAVLAAAVAAYEGTTTDGFVVRSIRKSARSRW